LTFCRLSFGVPGRLPRVVPEPGETFNGYFLPGGVCEYSSLCTCMLTRAQSVVSMSSWISQRNEEIFPDPMKFDPTRWLDVKAAWKQDNYMMPFGGGSRMCVGMP
jgi:hypothetical protein